MPSLGCPQQACQKVVVCAQPLAIHLFFQSVLFVASYFLRNKFRWLGTNDLAQSYISGFKEIGIFILIY
jgi:hypothetical protein